MKLIFLKTSLWYKVIISKSDRIATISMDNECVPGVARRNFTLRHFGVTYNPKYEFL